MLIERITDDVPHTLDGDQQLVDDIEVVGGLPLDQKPIDRPQGFVELNYLRLVQVIFGTKPFTQRRKPGADSLHALIERVVNLGMFLKLGNRLDKPVLQVEQFLVSVS